MEPHRPGSILLVVHVAQHSGPLHSLLPRLEPLAAGGTAVTTLVPGPGAAERMAGEVGNVMLGGPEALVMPRRPRQLLELPLLLHRQADSVRDALKATGADLVIASSALLPGALTAGRRAGAATLLYSGEVLGGDGLRGLLQTRAAALAGDNADAIIASSEAAAEIYRSRDLDATVLNPPISIRPPASDLDARARALETRLGIAADEKVVSTLGAITPGRGQDTLLEAWRLSAAHGSDWRLVIAGEPYERPADIRFNRRLREQAAALEDPTRVIFGGAIDDSDALFAASDVFANPVRAQESFGRASCEALVAGCPVVSTRVGGTTEALTHRETALLVPPDAPAEMSAAIDRLLYDRELADRLVTEGRRDIASRFSPGAGEATFMLTVDRALSEAMTREAAAQSV